MRFEFSYWEADVLPLNYARIYPYAFVFPLLSRAAWTPHHFAAVQIQASWCPIGRRQCDMSHVHLTDVTISRLPLSKARITYWDGNLPAFGVRCGARRKTFVVIVKPGHCIKLGNYPFTTL